MDEIRWGVVGTGPVSRGFSKALRRVPGAKPQAIYSRDLPRAQQFARQYGFARAESFQPAIFTAPDIDVFYIATPTATHREYCLAAIAAGKSVLCEKPMTANPEELHEVADAARSRGVFAMEGMWLRFNPVIQSCRNMLEQRLAGDILSVHLHVGYPDQAPDLPVRDAMARDALSVFGCYGFSLAHYLFGVPTRVLASGLSDLQGAVLHSNALLGYPSFEFQITSSIVATLSNSLEIIGSKGRLQIPCSVLDPYRSRWLPHVRRNALAKIAGHLDVVLEALRDQLAFLHPLRGSGFRAEIAAVGDCLRTGQTQCQTNPFEATFVAHAMQAAARRSMQGNRWEDVT